MHHLLYSNSRSRGRTRTLPSHTKVQFEETGIFEAHNIDVAPNGMSLTMPTKPAEEEAVAVRLEIYVDGVKRYLKAIGTVISCVCSGMDGFRVGIRFNKVDPDGQAALQEILK